MGFFADPSFFALTAAVIAVAAVLGLNGRRLDRLGLVASLLLVGCLVAGQPAQLVSLALFLVVSLGTTRWLMADPKSERRFVAAVALGILPLVTYKLTVSFASTALLGFAGISYATFKSVQILMEVHDGLIAREDMGLVDQLSFLLFFPTFDSGPIDRSRRFLEDARRIPPRDEYAGMLARGILLVLGGMAYKMVLATLVHRLYAPAAWGSGPFLEELWKQVVTCYAYGLYLFFDFAGYSMMAMGVGYCLGVRVPRNFRAPFLAEDLQDFWNRWHITLSAWLRDFVFMRLSRWLMRRHLVKGRLRTAQVALVADMLLMGLWHGVTIDYVAYGLYHGVLMAATEGFHKTAYYRAHKGQTWFRLASWAITMQLVFFGFALFSGQVSLVLKGVLNV